MRLMRDSLGVGSRGRGQIAKKVREWIKTEEEKTARASSAWAISTDCAVLRKHLLIGDERRLKGSRMRSEGR